MHSFVDVYPFTNPPMPYDLDVLPILDRAVIEKLRTRIGPAATREMLGLFVSLAPERIAALKVACLEGDADAARRVGHKLISSAGNLGLVRLVARARTLQAADGLPAATEAAARLLHDYEPSLSCIRDELSPPEP